MFFCSCTNNTLSNANWNNTIPYVPPITYGKVIKVYDGDTITIATKIYRKEPVYRFNVRLRNIDSPELKSKNLLEKEAAIVAQIHLEDKILNKNVFLTDVSTEKYGRILADVWLKNENLSKWMLDKRYAVPYKGKNKKIPKNWITYIQNGSFE